MREPRDSDLQPYAALIVGCGFTTLPLVVQEAWIGGFAATVAALPCLALLAARPGSIRPSVFFGAPFAMMALACLDLLQPIVFAPTGHHGPYGNVPPQLMLPVVVAAATWLVGAEAKKWDVRVLGVVAGLASTVMVPVVAHRTTRDATALADVVRRSTLVARVDAAQPLPVVTDGSDAIDLARIEKAICVAHGIHRDCEHAPTSWLTEETDAELMIRRVKSGWLVYLTTSGSDVFDAHAAVALSADGTPTSLEAFRLEGPIAAPRAWSFVAWGGGAVALLGVALALSRAWRFLWMLRAETVEHAGHGTATHPAHGTGAVDPAWPPGPLAVHATPQGTSAPYRSAWTALHVAQGAADDVHERFVDGLVAELCVCALVAATAAAPAFAAALFGRTLVVPW